jgi:hypothetical protein
MVTATAANNVALLTAANNVALLTATAFTSDATNAVSSVDLL